MDGAHSPPYSPQPKLKGTIMKANLIALALAASATVSFAQDSVADAEEWKRSRPTADAEEWKRSRPQDPVADAEEWKRSRPQDPVADAEEWIRSRPQDSVAD